MKSATLKLIIGITLGLLFVGLLIFYVANQNVPVLMPKGQIAQSQYNLIKFSLALSLIVIIPVFILAGYIGYKYRESNTKAEYKPDLDGKPLLEVIWWGVPATLIFIIGLMIWHSSYALDPYKKLDYANPLKVQVIALQWRWLFVYPEYNVASQNYLKFPQDRPVQFDITSDGPMNSFWIPALGSQIYAMPGMSTRLNLKANTYDKFYGSSANLSGKGFASMAFEAYSTNQQDFNQWVREIKKYGKPLDEKAYRQLARPSTDASMTEYSQVPSNLFDNVLMKYMQPSQNSNQALNGVNR